MTRTLNLPLDNTKPRAAHISRHYGPRAEKARLTLYLHTQEEVEHVRKYLCETLPDGSKVTEECYTTAPSTAGKHPLTFHTHALSADLPPPADYVRPTAAREAAVVAYQFEGNDKLRCLILSKIGDANA